MPEKTTAQLLAQYRDDLGEAGFDEGLVYELVRHLAFQIHETGGVCVATPELKPIEIKINGKTIAENFAPSHYDADGWNAASAFAAFAVKS